MDSSKQNDFALVGAVQNQQILSCDRLTANVWAEFFNTAWAVLGHRWLRLGWCINPILHPP